METRTRGDDRRHGLHGSNLLETIERCAEVRLLVAEPGEHLGATSTQDVRLTLLKLIEEVPGLVIAQRLGFG